MRISVVLLVLVMLFSMATGTMAAAVGYLDVLAGGTVDKESSNPLLRGEDDLKVTLLSAGTMFKEKFKIGAEYGFGTIEGQKDEDVSLWSVKGGYRFVDKLAFKLDGVVAPLTIDTDTSKLQTTLFGLETTLYFSKKMFLTGSYVIGKATYENDTLDKDDDVSIDMLRLKFHYFITENVGLVAGYTKLRYDFDAVMTGINLGSVDVGLGGPAVGLIYKF